MKKKIASILNIQNKSILHKNFFNYLNLNGLIYFYLLEINLDKNEFKEFLFNFFDIYNEKTYLTKF